MSLDGFIADPNGGYDWIVQDPSIDFAALYRQFDTAIMGRKTYEVVRAQGGDGSIPGLDVVVFSKTLAPVSKRGFRIVNEDPATVVRDIKSRAGGDIWLFGGGALFRTLLDAGVVDTVEVAVIPVMLGSGIPLLPEGDHVKLVLADHKILPASGIVALSYAVKGAHAEAPPIGYVKQRRKPRSRQR
jgi:dihydrofolate reductase